MKIYSITLSVLTLLFSLPTNAGSLSENEKITYRDSYVWYLANQLATSSLDSAIKNPLLPEDVSQLHFELALQYHHGLIACDGPLDEIATALKYSIPTNWGSSASISFDEALNMLGSTNEMVQPILKKWNQSVLPNFIKLLKTNKVTTEFPKCINPKYVMPPLSLTE